MILIGCQLKVMLRILDAGTHSSYVPPHPTPIQGSSQHGYLFLQGQQGISLPCAKTKSYVIELYHGSDSLSLLTYSIGRSKSCVLPTLWGKGLHRT